MERHLGSRILRNGMDGEDVKELQTQLIQLGYSCGSYGADGDFGDATEIAVRKFQKEHGCEVDGEVGPKTIKALTEALGDDDPTGYHVKIIGGNCYVRPEPVKNGKDYGIAREGEMYPYLNEKSPEGWLKIRFKGCDGWVSGMYGKLV